MNASTRARVAAIVVAAATGKNVSSIYDYERSAYRSMSVKVGNRQVTGYDYEASAHFSGGGSDLNFYDYDRSAHVQLKLKDKSFSGYDYGTSDHFSGTVNDRSVSLYDYGTCQYYNYSA